VLAIARTTRYAVATQRKLSDAVQNKGSVQMSTKGSSKRQMAYAALIGLGYDNDAVNELLQDKPLDAYRELQKHGWLWSSDLGRWRKAKHTSPQHTLAHGGGRSIVLAVRIIGEKDAAAAFLEQFKDALYVVDYALVAHHAVPARKPGSLIIYCTVKAKSEND